MKASDAFKARFSFHWSPGPAERTKAMEGGCDSHTMYRSNVKILFTSIF